MRKEFLRRVRTGFPAVVGIALVLMLNTPLFAQQHIVAQKDNTRPEATAYNTRPAFINFFSAVKWNGYNEIQWSATSQADTRKYIVEYSVNGVDYQTAGELLADKTFYTLQHRTLDDRPMLYRVRVEQLNGKFFYTPGVLLDGIPVPPVRIFPNTVTGSTVNYIADWPIERIVITSGSGTQVVAKEINGQGDYSSITLPATLGKGMYWMTFYGKDWKTTSKFFVP
jgi:hypothetical protein